jgi:hypothetical protein
MAVQILRKKFTVGQYHQMIESGILTDRDRVEPNLSRLWRFANPFQWV